jgi:hypothetical protein
MRLTEHVERLLEEPASVEDADLDELELVHVVLPEARRLVLVQRPTWSALEPRATGATPGTAARFARR